MINSLKHLAKDSNEKMQPTLHRITLWDMPHSIHFSAGQIKFECALGRWERRTHENSLHRPADRPCYFLSLSQFLILPPFQSHGHGSKYHKQCRGAAVVRQKVRWDARTMAESSDVNLMIKRHPLFYAVQGNNGPK
jgi:hypothetical protein